MVAKKTKEVRPFVYEVKSKRPGIEKLVCIVTVSGGKAEATINEIRVPSESKS